MNNKDPNKIERQLRELPDYKLNQSSKDTIHQQLMSSVVKQEEKERRGNHIRKFTAGIASVVVVSLFAFLGMTAVTNDDEPVPHQSVEQKEMNEFNKEIAREVMQQYKQSFATLMEAAGEDQLITTFDSQAGVKNHFTKVMSEDLASWMMDSYIEEKDGELYVIAKDSPTWLVENTDIEIEQVNDDHYKIIQERDNELLGHVEMIFHSKWEEGKWIVSDIESNELGEQPSIEDKARTIMNTIEQRNMERLSKYIHPEKGLLFSPYVFIEEDALVFNQGQISSLLNDGKEYTWGQSDGSGQPIQLTPSEYFDQILYSEPFQNPDQILVDDIKQRGNMKNNIKEIFPESKVVEFHRSGSDEYDGMDWASLNLVFEQDENGAWKLVGLVNDQWTI